MLYIACSHTGCWGFCPQQKYSVHLSYPESLGIPRIIHKIINKLIIGVEEEEKWLERKLLLLLPTPKVKLYWVFKLASFGNENWEALETAAAADDDDGPTRNVENKCMFGSYLENKRGNNYLNCKRNAIEDYYHFIAISLGKITSSDLLGFYVNRKAEDSFQLSF